MGLPPGYAPAATCSAKPGAEREPHPPQFWKSQGPVARIEPRKTTQILRAGNTAKPSKYASPRNGGSRGRAAWRQGRRSRFCRLRPPPSVFWFLFHVEKELAPHCARRRVSERNRRAAAALSAEMAKPRKIGRWGRSPALQSSSNDACFSDCPLIRPLRGHLPPRGKAFEGERPIITSE